MKEKIKKMNDLNDLANNMFDEYCEDGFDFNTSMTFDEIFRKIFTDAVGITIETYEKILQEEEE